MTAEDVDGAWMRRAIDLASRARGRTSPNPLVGCVLVRDGVCVGEGFHGRAGSAHAEACALQDAGSRARGATVYVSLEPCSHWGRTPPCVDALIQHGVARVVSAMADPDERVQGRGHDRLRAAGIRVDVGVLETAARRLNAAYILWKYRGTPHVTLKLASSLDGKAATSRGQSKWVTSPEARLDGHALRDVSDAILVGVGTVLADDPSLTVRMPGADATRDPMRLVLDSNARTPIGSKLLIGSDHAQVVIAVGEDADEGRVGALRAAGADVWRVPRDEDGLALGPVLERLGRQNILSLLVEGGPRVAGSFVRQRRVDRVVAYMASRLIGGSGALGSVGGVGIPELPQALPLEFVTVSRVGPDVRIEADVVESEPQSGESYCVHGYH